MRATRESPKDVSSASLLAHLTQMFPNQVDIRLYATPQIQPGSAKARLVGKRFNEGFGLQHMKVYGFDDDVIISGANLSSEYFSQRKDRYLLVKGNTTLADYLHTLILTVSRFSYALRYTGSPIADEAVSPHFDDYSVQGNELYLAPFMLSWDGGRDLLMCEDADGTVGHACFSHHTIFPQKQWAPTAADAVSRFTKRWRERTEAISGSSTPADTQIVPLLQMGPLGVTQERDMIPYMREYLGALHMSTSPRGNSRTVVDITSGYFSLSDAYRSLVLADELHSEPGRTPVSFRLVAASPKSNGFYKSKGLSGRIPDAYTYLEQQFWNEVVRKGLNTGGVDGAFPNVELREWQKYPWTYHEKGIWISPPEICGAVLPLATLIGSSNFGIRSEKLDLECTLLVTTSGPGLRRALSDEIADMREDANVIMDSARFESPSRRVSPLTRFLTRLVRPML